MPAPPSPLAQRKKQSAVEMPSLSLPDGVGMSQADVKSLDQSWARTLSGGEASVGETLFEGEAYTDYHSKRHDDAELSSSNKKMLGTIEGVYLPCLQNILGVIIFLRFPWIIGQAGTNITFVVVYLSVGCAFLTALSMSAIATNGRVALGGPYYMISRSLGPMVGASIGFLFFIGQTIAATMYPPVFPSAPH
jgi:hypothetical protein